MRHREKRKFQLIIKAESNQSNHIQRWTQMLEPPDMEFKTMVNIFKNLFKKGGQHGGFNRLTSTVDAEESVGLKAELTQI